MKSKIKELAPALLGVVFISAFPVVFLYCNNAGEADVSDALQPLLVFCALGLAVFLAFLLFTKSPGKSSIISGLFMLAFSNFSFLENGLKMVFPNLHYWHTLPILGHTAGEIPQYPAVQRHRRGGRELFLLRGQAGLCPRLQDGGALSKLPAPGTPSAPVC